MWQESASIPIEPRAIDPKSGQTQPRSLPARYTQATRGTEVADRTRVLVVEDEENLLNSLAFILEKEGFEVLRATTGEDGLAAARAFPPDIALLDVTLPGIDGFEVAARLAPLRTNRPIRIVMVTARDGEDEMVHALQTCADDYVVKPVRPRVLLARIASMLRAPNAPQVPPPVPQALVREVVRLGDLVVNPAAFEATVAGRPLGLTRSEFLLLHLLAGAPNQAFTREQILDALRGPDCVVTQRCVDFQVHGLRHKLGARAPWLVTVRGVGFKLCPA